MEIDPRFPVHTSISAVTDRMLCVFIHLSESLAATADCILSAKLASQPAAGQLSLQQEIFLNAIFVFSYYY